MKKICAVGILVLLALCSYSQKGSIENVYDITLRNAGVIKEDAQVKGYYFFYVSDKIDKKNNEFILSISDNNLKKIKDIKFQDSKNITILNSAFNGSELAFVLHNEMSDKLEYKIFSSDGKLKHSYINELEGWFEVEKMGKGPRTEDQLKQSLYGEIYPIKGEGFISKVLEKSGRSFNLTYYSGKSKKQWSYKPTGKFKMSGAFFLGTINNKILFHVIKFNGIFDKNPESSIIALDIETGKLLFENSTYNSKYKLFPSKITDVGNSKGVVYSEYYSADAAIVKDKSMGFALSEIDENGQLIKEKQFSWKEGLEKYFVVSDKGKIDDFGFLFIHDITQTDNGDLFLIGEGFKTSGLKTHTTDLMLLHFNKAMDLKEARIFPKQSNPVNLDGGGGLMSNQTKGIIMKQEQKFDYAYTVENFDKTSFTIGYTNYQKDKNYKGITFNSISYYEGKLTTDKLFNNSEATISAVLPAKQGQVLVLDYFKKDKRLEFHFEKMN
ncbi:MAG: DUF6770 family protein [Ginsengibacter sp.]